MFEFSDKEKGKGIVKFVDTLCKETPEIAFELLQVPIKYVGSWLTEDGDGGIGSGSLGVGLSAVQIAEMPCGCLIGATFIATCRIYPEVVDSVNKVTREDDVIGNAVVKNLPKALMVVDGDFGGMTEKEIQQVGLDVSDQVFSWEEAEFEKFIKNRIRNKLSISEN